MMMGVTSRDVRIGLELGGVLDEQGRYERPLPSATWAVPASIQTDGTDLIYREWTEQRRPRRRRAGPRMLEDFLGLAHMPAEAVVRYARQWGVLGLCRHGMPACHNHEGKVEDWCSPVGWEFGKTRAEQAREPLSYWTFYADKFRTLLKVTANARAGTDVGDTADWIVLHSPEPSWSLPPEAVTVPTLDGAPLFLGSEFHFYASLGDCRPVLTWHAGAEPRVELGGFGLFGALAWQILLAATGSPGLAFCEECRAPFRRDGRRKYCEDCGRPAALRAGAARQRKRRARLAEP